MKPDSPIYIKPSHKGLLHKHLGLKPGQPIPLNVLRKASTSMDPDIRKEANFALNAKNFNHSK